MYVPASHPSGVPLNKLVETFVRRTYEEGNAVIENGKVLSVEEALDAVRNYPNKDFAIPPMKWVKL